MECRPINNQRELDGLVAARPHSQFLQSWAWGEYQKRMGRNIIRLGLYQNGGLAACATAVRNPLISPFSYIYLPRGPVGANAGGVGREASLVLLEEVRRRFAGRQDLFLRLDPLDEFDPGAFRAVKTIDIQPPRSYIISLDKTVAELLAGMRPKTRYNIRLAERHGVTVQPAPVVPGAGDFGDFYRLLKETCQRDGFFLHPRSSYRELLNQPDGFTRLFFAVYRGKRLAAAIVVFYGDTAVYVHGASSRDCPAVMAPYLLHWRIMAAAKEEGCRYYDLFGHDECKWPGVTRFKRGFGGAEKSYPGTFDLVFSPGVYRLYRLLRVFRRGLRWRPPARSRS